MQTMQANPAPWHAPPSIQEKPMTVRRSSKITLALLLLAVLFGGTWLAEAEHAPASVGTRMVSRADAAQESVRAQGMVHPPASFAALMSAAYR
jgi:hypothetical protein